MRVVAAVGVPLVLLGLAEAGLRVVGVGHPTGFFRKVTIEGTDYQVPDRRFTHRFFPSGMAREPLPFRMAAEKAPGTFRIFLYGESAAYGDPEPAYGVGRFLEALLESRHPGTDVEVVCTAITAINSHVILPIAREAVRHEGDLWVVYMGNNEMVGPFGAGTIFGTRAPSRAWVETQLLVRSTRIGQLMARAAGALGPEGKGPESWRGIEMFSQHKLAHDDPGRLQAQENFEGNLEDVLQLAGRAGIPVLLSTVATNLRDCAPFVSLSAPLPPEQAAAWDRHHREGLAAEERGEPAQALAAFEAASAIDPGHAETWYRIGRCRLALGRIEAAREAFVLARDHDALAVRADTRINRILLDAMERHRGAGLIGLDAASLLAAQVPDGLPGQETFHEHVHFTVEGNFRLARLMADAIAGRLPAAGVAALPAEEEFRLAAERLAYSLWDRKRVWNVALDRVSVPPFTSQSSHARTVAFLQDRMLEVDRVTTRASWSEVERLYDRVLDLHPDDTLVRWNLAQFLERSGRTAEAIVEGKGVCRRLPHHAWPHYFVGSLLAKQRRPGEAVEYLRLALELQPDVPFAREELERVLAAHPSLR